MDEIYNKVSSIKCERKSEEDNLFTCKILGEMELDIRGKPATKEKKVLRNIFAVSLHENAVKNYIDITAMFNKTEITAFFNYPSYCTYSPIIITSEPAAKGLNCQLGEFGEKGASAPSQRVIW